MTAAGAPAEIELLAPARLRCGDWAAPGFWFTPRAGRPPGAVLWMFMDIRQDPGVPQADDPRGPNYVSAAAAGGSPVACRAYLARTLDLYPRLPEFLYVCEFSFARGLAPGETVAITLGAAPPGWQAPKHPIRKFAFWFLDPPANGLAFLPTGYKSYHAFNVAEPEKLQSAVQELSCEVAGEYPGRRDGSPAATPGILWGDPHGMVFNQRPLDDFYHYAREIARLDFAAALLFSYNTCVGDVWQNVKAAARRWTEPGRFTAIAGFEAGTLPDGSHRNAYFFEPDGVPPIFCEDRPPARDPRLVSRFHPQTISCDDLASFYRVVARYGGIVTGHFHTWQYREELLAEIWQKQVGAGGDEERIFGLLNQGLRLGIVGGSDTHDSMPANSAPEPYCPQAGGLTAVLAERNTGQAIQEAFQARRVYATTGARIELRFLCQQAPMGSSLPVGARRQFQVRVKGTAGLAAVELVRGGQVVQVFEPGGDALWEEWADPHPNPAAMSWYLVSVTQRDGHRAWSSPIWFLPDRESE